MNKKATQWLVEKNIPSFSPQTGMLLLKIAKEVRDELVSDKTMTGEDRHDIVVYADALESVARAACDHQGAVLAKLTSLIG